MSLHKFAEQVAANGRGDDSLLVHMTPDEVRKLQQFAEANGTTLTINPETGLPEAGFLSDLFKAVAPIALGAFLGPAGLAMGGGFMSAGMAGLTVGGITTLATGSLSRGLMAGLGAYGGAGLGESLMGAGDAALGAQAASQGAGLTGDMAFNLGDAGITESGIQSLGNVNSAAEGIAQNRAAFDPTKLSTMSRLGAGAQAVVSDPTSAMDFAKNNWKSLAAAAAPIMAGQMVPTTTKMPVDTNPAYIRQKLYDPYTQTYKSLAPVKASEFGGRNFSDAYTNPQTGIAATLDQRQPTPMAGGGIVALARGGIPGYALGGAPKTFSDEELYQQTGSWEAAAEARDQQNRASNIYADAQSLAAAVAPVTGGGGGGGGLKDLNTTAAAAADPYYFQVNPDVAASFTQNSYGMTPEAFAQAHYTNFGQKEGREFTPSAAASYAAANNIDLVQNANQWILDNPFATNDQIKAAMTASGLSQGDVNRSLNALVDSGKISAADRWNITSGKGLAGVSDSVEAWLEKFPNATQAQINDALKAAGMDKSDAQSPYVHGYQVATDQTAAAQKYLTDNKDVAAWLNSQQGKDYIKEHPEFDAADIAFTHYKRYGEAEGRKWGLDKKVVTPVVQPPTSVVPGNVLMPGGFVYNNGAISNYGNDTGNPLTRTPGDIINNPNGTVSVVPNIPGRPYGGFPGMESVRNSYTAGGGSLGYTAKAPKDMDEFNQRFNKQTDDSLAAYNFLMGKGKNLAQVNAASNKTLMQPYFTGSNRYKPRFLSYDKDGQVVSSGTSGATGDAKASELTKAKTIDIIDDSGNNRETYTATLQEDGTYLAGNGKRYDVTGKQLAAGGGMMGYAVGGGLGSLGSYSDGGRLLKGPGDGVSDSIPATIGAKNQPARLADGEFVIPARIVSELGNGSTDAGAKKLYAMMDRVQRARGKTTGKNKVAANSRADKHLPA